MSLPLLGGGGERSDKEKVNKEPGVSFTPADRNRKAKGKQSWREDGMRRDKRKTRRKVRKKAKGVKRYIEFQKRNERRRTGQ